MITIDGSYKEGGGQIVRTALALSTLLQKACTVTNIRSGRPTPGLKQQHLWGIRGLRDMCNGVVEGAQLGSEKIVYYPRPIKKGAEITIDVGTAGSLTLLLQSLLLPAMFSGKRFVFVLTGGSDVSWSPSYDYFAHVVLPHFLRYGTAELKLQKRGYYPKGQGSVSLTVKKRHLFSSLTSGEEKVKQLSLLEQGSLVKIAGISHASADLSSARVAERQAHAARVLLQKAKVPIDILSSYNNTSSTGSGITLWAIYSRDSFDVDSIDPLRIGADVLGKKGVKAEKIGEDVATTLNVAMQCGAAVDAHLADQLIPLLGLVGGEIAVQEITDHTRANIYVVEQFLGKMFHVDETLRIIRVKKGFFACN